MLKTITDPLALSKLLRCEPFQGIQHKCGVVKVVTYKVDDAHPERWTVRLACSSCHQVFRMYGYLWDKWLHTGRPFDEFRLVKEERKYYADISYAALEDSRLRVSVVINKRIMNGYENDKDDNNSLFGYKA
jgi:hypothetical protein